MLLFARTLPGITIVGIDCHIGSQLTTTAPFVDALRKVSAFVGRLAVAGIPIRYFDVGGGLGITYDAEQPPHPSDYAGEVRRVLHDCIAAFACTGITLVFEPGRVLVGNAGVLLTRVLYLKENEAKRFVVVDGAMNDLIRPSLYDAHHAIAPVIRDPAAAVITADVVGPVCESGDFFAQDRALPLPARGDLLAVMSAGAYGFAMSSNYNSRPRAAEVLVDGDGYRVVRRRETIDDLIRGEQ